MDRRTFIFVLTLTFVLFGVNIFFEQQHQEKLKEWNAKQELKTGKKTNADVPQKEETTAKPFLNDSSQLDKKSNEQVEEKFYLIENNYQQLLFSNKGGALVEINLPFNSKTNEESVVKETELDREMKQDHPDNARFPLRPFFTSGTNIEGLTEHKEGTLGGFYPLLRRGLATGHEVTSPISPKYYATNIVSEYPEVAELTYIVKEFTPNKIVFEANQPQRRITKTYWVENGDSTAPYCVNLTIKIEGDSRGLWIVSGIPEVEWISGAIAPALKYRITRNMKPEVNLLDLPKDSLVLSSLYPDWVCNSNGFFGIIMDPLSKIDGGLKALLVPGKNAPSRLTKVDEAFGKFKSEDLPGYMLQLPLNSNGGTMDFRLFTGPFSKEILTAVDGFYTDTATGYNPDYVACQTFHGWFSFISEPFAKFLFVLMSFFHQITSSWGFSIILLTVALRIMLYPLNAWSTRSMLKMQKIGPQVTAIQERYKKDPTKAQTEVMNLYRQEGVNPVSGCLPLLIQMPFLIGMFDLLKSTFELRGASFIPGWIDDLSAPDVLFSWEQPILFIGNQFHLLPILLGAVMFLQQKISSTAPKDPKLMTDQQRQQQTMGTIMAVVFAFMFYNFPSGLNIYWLSSMLLGMLQQWWMSKRLASTKLEITKVK